MESDNMMRGESILILPKNTLRLTDAMVQLEINKAQNNLFKDKFDEMIWKLVSRTQKDLSLYNKDVDKDLIDELYKVNFHTYYDLSPRTLMYEIIDIMINQKFVTKSVILFDNANATDETYRYEYYDGSIKSLENYINDNGVTCMVFDDMELLKTLYDRGNVSFKRKTFIVSKMGYNYYKDEHNRLRLKYYDEIHKNNPTIELTSIDLYNFSKDVIDKFSDGKI